MNTPRHHDRRTDTMTDASTETVVPIRRRPRKVSDLNGDLSADLHNASMGDAAAFAHLYDATAARLYGLTYRILRNAALAEEVAQESFLEIWRTSTRFDPERGSAIGWMMTVAHRRAVDRVRAERSRSGREEAYHYAVLPLRRHLYDPTHHEAQSRFEADRVRKALALLSHVQREALELAYFGGYTHSQLARHAGIPLGTAKSRLRDGIRHLRDLLNDEGHTGCTNSLIPIH